MQNNSNINSNYLESVKKQFEYYKLLGEKTFAQSIFKTNLMRKKSLIFRNRNMRKPVKSV